MSTPPQRDAKPRRALRAELQVTRRTLVMGPVGGARGRGRLMSGWREEQVGNSRRKHSGPRCRLLRAAQVGRALPCRAPPAQPLTPEIHLVAPARGSRALSPWEWKTCTRGRKQSKGWSPHCSHPAPVSPFGSEATNHWHTGLISSKGCLLRPGGK